MPDVITRSVIVFAHLRTACLKGCFAPRPHQTTVGQLCAQVQRLPVGFNTQKRPNVCQRDCRTRPWAGRLFANVRDVLLQCVSYALLYHQRKKDGNITEESVSCFSLERKCRLIHQVSGLAQSGKIYFFLFYSFSSHASVFTPDSRLCCLVPLQWQSSLLQVKFSWWKWFTLIILLHLDESSSDHREHIAHRLCCHSCSTIIRLVVEIGGSLVPHFSHSVLPIREGISIFWSLRTSLSPREFSPPHPFFKNELGITVQCVRASKSY